MTTFNTGNPIGSTAVKDLYDNAENLDVFVNDRTKRSEPDRLGVSRKTWYGMEQDFQDFLINSGYQSIGDYAAGLEITARNQIFWRDGELYRVGASVELPYTTTGDWTQEEGLFVAVGDQSLRQELGQTSGSLEGADIVGVSGSTLQGFFRDKVSIEAFGAIPGQDISDACDAALAELRGTDRVLYLPNAVYSISRTIRLDGLNVYSDGCEIQKTHNGVGIEIQGGADYWDLEGTLYIRGVGEAFYDPVANPAPPANPDAHGVWFNSARIRIRGKIICQNHQGDLFRFTCQGNMNKTNIDSLWGWWGNRGVYFEGTQDDFSVCQINLFMQFMWGSGIATSNDFMGRNWNGFWYTEGCSIDNVSHAVDIKRLRSCNLEIYSEQRNSAREIVLGDACTYNKIMSHRRNNDQDLAGDAGKNLWINGSTTYSPGAVGDTRTATVLTCRSLRARAGSPGEYVDLSFEAGQTLLGRVRGEGGVGTPYIKLVSASGQSEVSLSNNMFSAKVDGTTQISCQPDRLTLGNQNFTSDGQTNAKEIESNTNILKSSRNSSSSRDHLSFYNTNGLVGAISTSGSSTIYGTTSDARLKKDIKESEGASEIIDRVKVCSYSWKGTGEKERFGVIAQDVEKVFPEAVSSGELYAVDYSKFVPLLIKEIQELRCRVRFLEDHKGSGL